jgi:hypothetical protein
MPGPAFINDVFKRDPPFIEELYAHDIIDTAAGDKCNKTADL